jgi:signal transduction histidine kinase
MNNPAAAATITILVVEDDNIQRNILTKALTNQGYSVLNAGDAEQAKQRLSDCRNIDLAILDINLPGKSGLELAKEINLPFILLTAHRDEAIVQQGLNIPGALDYIVKPFNLENIGPKIKYALELARQLAVRSRLFEQESKTRELELLLISQEMHDEFAHRHFALKCTASNIRTFNSNNDSSSIDEELDNLDQVIDELANFYRHISKRLKPESLYRLGIINATREIIEEKRKTNPECVIQFDYDDASNHLNLYIQFVVYRIIEECLRNALKHGKATAITVSIQCETDTLVVGVIDNGIGIDTGKASAGNGLEGVQARARIFKGKTVIESGPGKGTSIRIELPIHSEDYHSYGKRF